MTTNPRANLFAAIAQELRIVAMKRKARRLLTAHRQMAGGDSGVLAAYVSPSLARTAQRFNDTMDRLAQLDPACPRDRL